MSISLSQKKHLSSELEKLLLDYSNPALGNKITALERLFMYRIFLGRMPDPALELNSLIATDLTYREILQQLQQSPEFSRQPGYLPAGHSWMAEVDDFRLWFDTGDREMGIRMALGMFEPEATAALKKFVRPGMKCLDVGANIGFYTCQLAKLVGPTGKVWAFEPMPESFKLLRKNIAENGWQERVEAFNVACSDISGNTIGTLVSNMYILGQVAGSKKVDMNTVALDQVISSKIDFVKIDIEGHEPTALRGMERILSNDRPLILTEVNSYWLKVCSNVTGQQFLELLHSLDYNCHCLNALNKPLDISSFSEGALSNIEILAIPR